MSDQEILSVVQKHVEKMKELLEVDATVNYDIEEISNSDASDHEQHGDSSNKGPAKVVNISFEGDNLGHMIGYRGGTLGSLQYILSLIVKNELSKEDFDSRLYITVDVGGYKAKRFQKIEEIALRKADDARILGEPIDLEPMNGAERRVVHMSLQKFDDIKTESYGEGRDRYVRIVPVDDEDLGIGKTTEEADAGGESEENEQ